MLASCQPRVIYVSFPKHKNATAESLQFGVDLHPDLPTQTLHEWYLFDRRTAHTENLVSSRRV